MIEAEEPEEEKIDPDEAIDAGTKISTTNLSEDPPPIDGKTGRVDTTLPTEVEIEGLT